MAILYLKFEKPMGLPAMTDEYLLLAQLFGKFTETEIPAHMSPNITPDGWTGKIELKTYPSPANTREDTVAAIRTYQNEVMLSSGGGAERVEQVKPKEVLVDTKMVDEQHPIVPIASLNRGHEGITLEALVIYRPSFIEQH